MRGELMLCEIGDIEYLRHYPEQTPDLTGNGGGNPSSAHSGANPLASNPRRLVLSK